jgi:transposase
MSLGNRRRRQRQKDLFLTASELPRSAAHPFYSKLNALLDEHGFDAHAEALCARFYAETIGRPSLAPGVYFRCLLIGYFEGLDSERAIAWRIADSLSLRRFLDDELDETTPDHSTLSRTRRRLDLEAHRAVFGWALALLTRQGLLAGRTVGVDATTLEANAAMRSLVRRDTDEGYEEYLRRLARESGIETPTREQLAKIDKKRKNKASNKDWKHPGDPDARVTKMKDGRTHLAYKAEHAVDLETGAVVAVTLQGADQGDTTTIEQTLTEAAEQLEAAAEQTEDAGERVEPVLEVIADKGYHSNGVLTDLKALEIRSYISEPDHGRRNWKGKARERAAVYGNRRRIRGARGKALLRLRGERVERSFAHCYETGGMRRVHLRGRENILKRLLVHVGAFNLSLAMRKRLGAGTPRGLADALKAPRGLAAALGEALEALAALLPTFGRRRPAAHPIAGATLPISSFAVAA